MNGRCVITSSPTRNGRSACNTPETLRFRGVFLLRNNHQQSRCTFPCTSYCSLQILLIQRSNVRIRNTWIQPGFFNSPLLSSFPRRRASIFSCKQNMDACLRRHDKPTIEKPCKGRPYHCIFFQSRLKMRYQLNNPPKVEG